MILKRHNRVQAEELLIDETIFATQNRWLGVRGNLEEGTPYNSTIRGTYINGFYDTHPIKYGEKAYGFPELAQTLVNVPDAQTIKFFAGEETIDMNDMSLVDLKRSYDLEKGFTKRKIIYENAKKQRFILTFIRRTHLKHKALFINEVQIETENYHGPLHIVSILNGDVENYISKNDPRIAHTHHKKITVLNLESSENYGYMVVKTKRTQCELLAGITHSCDFEYSKNKNEIAAKKTIEITPQKPFRFIKYAVYHTAQQTDNLEHAFQSTLLIIKKTSFKDLIEMHEIPLKPFLSLSNIKIESEDKNLNETIAYNLYQLYTSGAANENLNIAAKGLTGEGYEGHTFWDTEIYLNPYFLQIDPEIAKNLILYRYHQLPNAKKEARNLGINEGVKFAWRTINGDEASAYYPAGTAQYHINSDIAYAVIKYYQLTKDALFMKSYGLEILIETARFFKHVVHKHNDQYHMHHVTGPDEYTAVVDNNFYTNSLLKYHLSFLIRYLEESNFKYLSENELNHFKDIRDHLVFNYDKTLNIDAQDQTFLTKKKWDFKATSQEQFPLLMHFHPLTIYRHQVLKQPDVVLSHLLLNNRPFDIQKASFNYYEPLTTHDSSLSYCIHATQAARLNYLDKALHYLNKIVALDIDNLHGNTQFGLHMANLGGVYLTLLKGFLGYQINEDVELSPRIPKTWKSYEMTVRVNLNTTVRVHVNPQKIRLTATQDCTLIINKRKIDLFKNQLKELSS